MREIINKTRYTWYDRCIPSPVFISQNWKKLTEIGINGDALLATKEKREKLVQAVLEKIVDFIEVFNRDVRLVCLTRSSNPSVVLLKKNLRVRTSPEELPKEA